MGCLFYDTVHNTYIEDSLTHKKLKCKNLYPKHQHEGNATVCWHAKIIFKENDTQKTA